MSGKIIRGTLGAALGVAALAAVVPASWAAQPGWYVSGQAGATFLDDSDSSDGLNVRSEHDTGVNISGALGRDLGTGLRLEGEIGYRDNDLNRFNFRNDRGLGARRGVGSLNGLSLNAADGDVSSVSFMANVFYDFDLRSPLTPYVGGGIGFANVSINNAAANFAGIRVPIADDDDTVFAWQLGAGLGYTMNPWTTVSLDYRYFATDDPTFIDVTGREFKSQYQTNNVSLNLRYNF